MISDSEIMAEVFTAFKAEQAEHRQAIGDLLLDLERDPDHPNRRAMLDQLFREAHSLKGGARAAGLISVEQIAHRVEDIFAAVRQGTLVLTPELCDPIYITLDAIGALMEQAAPGRDPGLGSYTELFVSLGTVIDMTEAGPVWRPELAVVSLLSPAPPQGEPVTEPAFTLSQTFTAVDNVAGPGSEQHDTSGSAPHLPIHSPQGHHEEQRAAHSGSVADETLRLSIAVLDSMLNEAGELMTCSLRARQLARDAQAIYELPDRWRRLWRRIGPTLSRLRETGSTLDPIVHHLDDRDSVDRWYNNSGAQAVTVDAHVHEPLLDALEQANTLIAELTTRLGHLSRQASEDQTRLAAVTDRLYTQVRRTRMLPLATLINPLRLQVREMARAAGKHAALELEDRGAEADRQVLDQLREVFTQLLRNAIDHGIETPEVRAAAGKPALSVIVLRTAVSGDRLTLTLEDDGAGLDFAAIGQRALAAGMLSPVELERSSEADLADLIFLPGFSTRQTISALSGRGVGLDIVRSRVERMHGHVVVQSRAGAGTSFTINVPLSLTSSHGLLVRIGGADYVMPLEAVQHILMPTPGQIQILEGRPVLRVNGRPLPVATLNDLFGIAGDRSQSVLKGMALILGSGDRQVACIVDTVLDEQELVVHRLPPPLLRVRFLSGATILADGRVVPILDVVDLVRAAAGVQGHSIQAETSAVEEHRAPVILVADDSITTRTLEKNILEAAGYRVVLATDGQAALEALRGLSDNGGCDLLLSDIDMPRLNGFDLTAQVRADAQLRHLPVVLVTSLDSAADRERGVGAGADAYIVKRAFDQQTLLDTIAQLI